MALHPLVGQRVRILAWEKFRDDLPAGPFGTITQVMVDHNFGFELFIRVDGVGRTFTFSADEIQPLSRTKSVAAQASNALRPQAVV